MSDVGNQTPPLGPQSGVYIYCAGELVRVISRKYARGRVTRCSCCRARVRITW